MSEDRRYVKRRSGDIWRTRLIALVVTLLTIGAIGFITVAYVVVREIEARLNNDVTAECYRVQYLRWSVDYKSYLDWQRDEHAGDLLQHGISAAVRKLGTDEKMSARQEMLLPLTDCARAVSDPQRYRPSLGVPFTSLSPRYLREFFAHPPPQSQN